MNALAVIERPDELHASSAFTGARTHSSALMLIAEHDRSDANLYLACSAWEITADTVNFMATHGFGLICLALREDQARRLRVDYMTPTPTNPRCATFGCSIEARDGVTTGISAADRALTMRIAADPAAIPSDLVSPGHVFPVIVSRGENSLAATILARTGEKAAAAFCAVLLDNGAVARRRDVGRLAWASSMTCLVGPKSG